MKPLEVRCLEIRGSVLENYGRHESAAESRRKAADLAIQIGMNLTRSASMNTDTEYC